MNEVGLREYIERVLEERDRAHHALHVAAEAQLRSTAQTLDEKLKAMNEFRAQIGAERLLYVQKEYLQAQMARVDERMEALERWQSNVSGRAVIFGAAIVVLSGLVALALRLVGH